MHQFISQQRISLERLDGFKYHPTFSKFLASSDTKITGERCYEAVFVQARVLKRQELII